MLRSRVVLPFLFALSAAPLPAAASGASTPVLESHVGERPAGTGALLGPMWRQLDDFDRGEPLGRSIDRRLSAPATSASRPVAEAIGLADQGYEHWLDGDFDAATKKLHRAIEGFHANPARFATHADERPLLYKALLALAGSHQRMGQRERAVAAMAELVRSFPDTPFNRAMFPPDAHLLYRSVREDVLARRPGTLRVEVDDDSVSIFVNERFVGSGGSYRAEVPPGSYRVYTHKGGQAGRLHHVDVSGGVEARVDVHWSLESALRTGPDFVGFEFHHESARAEHETPNALMVARRLDASSVVVVGIRDYLGRRSVVGTVLSVDTGKAARTAAVALEPTPPSPDTVRALGRFLAGGEPAPELILPDDRPAVTVEPATAPGGIEYDRGRHYGAWKWAALGAGIIAAGTGAVFIELDGPILDDDGSHTPEQYETRNLGIGLVAGGAALAGTGLLLWLLEDSGDVSPSAAAIVPTADGLAFGVGGAF